MTFVELRLHVTLGSDTTFDVNCNQNWLTEAGAESRGHSEESRFPCMVQTE